MFDMTKTKRLSAILLLQENRELNCITNKIEKLNEMLKSTFGHHFLFICCLHCHENAKNWAVVCRVFRIMYILEYEIWRKKHSFWNWFDYLHFVFS